MGGELRDKVAGGVAWNMAEKVGTMGLQTVVGIIVARLLAPGDYGVMGVLTVFTSIALVVVDSGFSQALIRKQVLVRDDCRSVFLFHIAVSLALYALLTVTAPIVARYYDAPVIARIAPVLFLLLPLNALGVIQSTLFTRNFRFALLSKLTFASSLAGGAVALGMALAGCGVWSLVGQRVAAMGVRTALFWAWGERNLGGRFDGKALRALAPFSLRLLSTDLIASLYNNAAQLFIGKLYSVNQLGYFNQGQKLKDLPVTSTVQAVQNVTYPAFLSIGGDRPKFVESLRQVVAVVSFVLFPAMTGLIAVAPDLFAVLLGAKWMPTVPYFEILCLAGLFSPLSTIAVNILKVKSDGRVLVRIEIWKRVIMTAVLAATIPVGVKAIAWGLSAMALIEMGLNFGAATRYAEVRIGVLLRPLALPLLLSALLFAAVRFGMSLMPEMAPVARLAVSVAIGAAAYSIPAWLLRPEALRIVLESIRKRIDGRKKEHSKKIS